MPDIDLSTPGARLKSLREKYKIKQKDVAASTGLNVKTISQIENDHTFINSVVIQYYTTNYKASADWILNGTGKPDDDKKVDLDSFSAIRAKVFAIESELSEMKDLLRTLIKKIDDL
jgi:transcriptional regulator with XRE-family HTH domain